MSEDAGAGAEGTGTADAGTPAGAADAGGDPAEMLASALSDDGADDDADSGDPAKRLEAAEREAAKWKDLSRKNETAAKRYQTQAQQGQEAAKKLAAIEDAQKTELQREADARAAAEQRAAEAEGRYHRTLAAATYGLPPALIDTLSGGSEDEINANAEAIAAEINNRVAEQVASQLATAQAAANGNGGGSPTAAGAAMAARGRRPVEAMRAGASPSGRDAPRTGGEWLRGQYDDLRSK
jgi:hypothetical protein